MKCLVSRLSEKHICWFIGNCFLLARSAAFVTWCSFTDHWYIARRCDPGSRCWSNCCAQKHWPIPVDTLSKHHNGARPAVLRKYWSILLADESRFRFGRSDEHGWDEIRLNSPDTLGELGEDLSEVWQNILRVFLENLTAPVPHRCIACVNVNGGQTHYW